MTEFDYDLFVIGGGSGGVRGARIAAGYGAKVGLAEEAMLGGTCVNVGCIPKKLFVYASHYAEAFEDARAYGWSPTSGGFDWATLLANKDEEIARLNGVYGRILRRAGVEVHAERATLVGPHEVVVGERHFRCKYIMVAVGGRPRLPDIPGAELADTSNEAFHWKELPKRVLIVGGGYIAVEFAGILHGMGCQVRLAYRGPLFLRGFDDDVRAHLADEMRRKGIDLCFELEVEELEKTEGGVRAFFSDETDAEYDAVLFAIGRVPKVAGLGLEDAGVKVDEYGAIIVDEYSQTSVPSVYAVGDVTNRVQLTPVALAEGMAVAATLFDNRPTKPDHETVPSAVFSQPEIGTVGLTEGEAHGRFGQIDVYRSSFRPLLHTLTGREEKTLMKLVVDRKTQRVVGMHMVGPHAGEITQGFAVAIKMGASKAQFDETIGIHPTAAEELVTMRTPAEQ
jgi:glutathione reductase (NADPH)